MSILLLAVAVTMFAASFPATSQSILRDRHRDVAASACVKQLEYWRGVGYSSLPAMTSSTLSQSFTVPTDLLNGTGTVTFTRVDDSLTATSTETGKRKVEATVTWTGQGKDRGTVALTSLLVQ
ncbi:MAG: hypothetical protein FJX77_14630 [Armatimonadetes bacterium]|nr:hypothetical protein [Armatimonadota bacterium]MBM3947061.1 hypothetical protein [SAR202 cluster bacterium]